MIAVGDPAKQENFDLDLRDLAPATPSVTGTPVNNTQIPKVRFKPPIRVTRGSMSVIEI